MSNIVEFTHGNHLLHLKIVNSIIICMFQSVAGSSRQRRSSPAIRTPTPKSTSKWEHSGFISNDFSAEDAWITAEAKGANSRPTTHTTIHLCSQHQCELWLTAGQGKAPSVSHADPFRWSLKPLYKAQSAEKYMLHAGDPYRAKILLIQSNVLLIQ